MAGLNSANIAALDAAARQRQRQQLLGLNAFDRHKRFVHDLVSYYGGQLPPGGPQAPVKTDLAALKDGHRFIRSAKDDAEDSWEVRLAKRYYARLYKEYGIADLSRYKEGKVGLRWRTQSEVVSGKGQFSCGARGCEERRGLASFEVPFGYEEAGERKQALVKVRVCPEHAYQLNYRKNRDAERAAEKQQQKAKRSNRVLEDPQPPEKKHQRDRRSTNGRVSADSEAKEQGEEGTGHEDDDRFFAGLFE